ncbi:MAG: ABC transporter permease [Clostridia bacterium]|nr:ABC transporter permease [Clostridia bacterium]
MRSPSREVRLVAKKNWREFVRNNVVTIMFIVVCAVCMAFSGYKPNYVMYELFGRLSRNAFIVLALIIPIVAGMGINFAITIGAMAAQIACILVLEWGIQGFGGFLVAAALTVPMASVFGFLIGKILNKMKGQEMIGGMILGYFANGLYQLLCLFIFDNIIPINNPDLTIKGSKGIANTMDLSKAGGMGGTLEKLWRLPMAQATLVFAAVIALILIIGHVRSHRKNNRKLSMQLSVLALVCVTMQLPIMKDLFSMVQVPMATFGIVALLCLFNVLLMRTRLGQQFRAVGQNRTVANAAGINVDKVRIIAITISTVLAGWGQLIFVQNLGAFQTYGAADQVGLYAGAAILVGGASVVRATNTQALLGTVLFHLMFILAPAAGKNLFGDAAIGEYFRVFMCYGVIALALVMHAWSSVAPKKKPKLTDKV